MKTKENFLFVGNGLNRCLSNSISWGALLEEIALEFDVRYCKETPMPLEFERMANEYLERHPSTSTTIYTTLKAKIAERLCRVVLPDNSIHHDLKELPINGIITTNYDYLLEYAFNPYFKSISGTKKYLFEKTSEYKGISFYHAHGNAGNKPSLCLGYEHYMGIVQRLRNDLNRKIDNKKENMEVLKILRGENAETHTWGEKFYTSNIAFVGFELNECEADIWWLLTHRASLYYSNYCDAKKYLNNKIVFYDILDTQSKSDIKAEQNRKAIQRQKEIRHLLLKQENVVVHTYEIGNEFETYEEAYRQIIKDIRGRGVV